MIHTPKSICCRRVQSVEYNARCLILPRMQSSPPGWNCIFRIGDPELKPPFATVTGRGDNPINTHRNSGLGCLWYQWALTELNVSQRPDVRKSRCSGAPIFAERFRESAHVCCIHLGYCPLPLTVTTRSIIFVIGDSYKPSKTRSFPIKTGVIWLPGIYINMCHGQESLYWG